MSNSEWSETEERPVEPTGSDWSSYPVAESPVPKPIPASQEQALNIEDLYGSRRGSSSVWKGRRMGQYRLQRLLGAGTMAVVIQAEDVNLHRTVAIKLLRRKVKNLSRSEQVEQFFREAKCAASLDHPNIVQTYGFEEYQGHWFLIMEHMEGGSLTQLIERTGPLSPRRASLFLADAAAGIADAHAAGILHRDIKPSNLLLTRTGRCKVADFGLALPSIQGDEFRLSSAMVGTPHYAAPEVLQKKPAGTASDVYSLAATLYSVMTGRPPFPTDNARELLKEVSETPAPDIREIVPHAPQVLADLIVQGLSKHPRQRPSAAEMDGVLRSEMTGLSDVAAPSDVPSAAVKVQSQAPQSLAKSGDSVIAPPEQAAPQRAASKPAMVFWRGQLVPAPQKK